ncbi:MAG TPA: anhydro-N-acetylmuramic acid kinase, partial [Cytophagaceae bacterium]|nr:anhydro-N-acetylmuramic acid kinase [Cytophagaceae bacterium]
NGTAQQFAATDAFFGKFSGKQVQEFLSDINIHVDLIASHGHTIFHQPQNGFTSQIGNGAFISAITNIPVVSDLRTMDVAYGGQGAPLVPIGDQLLFGDYDYCLNIGGIANVSFKQAGRRIAGDLCAANIVLNKLAEENNKRYDNGGKMAASGKINDTLFGKLNKFGFYKKDFPKSLGREWIEKEIFPLLDASTISVEDKLATVCEHIAYQISLIVLPHRKKTSVLVTGGGAFNEYLIGRIRKFAGEKIEIVLPNAQTISYKEAVIFAFLGLKRVLGEVNALSSVTGASQDSIGGALYGMVRGKN